jgi:cell division protein FtsZ
MKLFKSIPQEQINTSATNEETIHSNSLETESVVEDSSVNEMEKSFTQEAIDSTQEQTIEESIQEDVSNDLKEFGVDSDAPDLFSSETENSSSDDLLSSSDEEMMILKYQRS